MLQICIKSYFKLSIFIRELKIIGIYLCKLYLMKYLQQNKNEKITPSS